MLHMLSLLFYQSQSMIKVVWFKAVFKQFLFTQFQVNVPFYLLGKHKKARV